MSPLYLGLAVTAGLAAALSAVTGVGGGIVLLSVLLVALDPRAVVPVHGAVQLVANGTRVVAFREHVAWPIVGRFALTLVPGSILGALLVNSLSARALQVTIASGILLTLVPWRKAPREEQPVKGWLFPLLGLATGFFGMIAGSTGPIVTQALLWSGVVKERHIATKSVCQAMSHGIKIPLFGLALGFDFTTVAPLIVVMSGAVVVGTVLGKRLLAHISDETFTRATRLILGGIAAKILLVG